MNWLIIKINSKYCVGFYDPNGMWIPYKDFFNDVNAEMLVNYLNGGDNRLIPEPEKERIKRALLRRIK